MDLGPFIFLPCGHDVKLCHYRRKGFCSLVLVCWLGSPPHLLPRVWLLQSQLLQHRAASSAIDQQLLLSHASGGFVRDPLQWDLCGWTAFPGSLNSEFLESSRGRLSIWFHQHDATCHSVSHRSQSKPLSWVLIPCYSHPLLQLICFYIKNSLLKLLCNCRLLVCFSCFKLIMIFLGAVCELQTLALCSSSTPSILVSVGAVHLGWFSTSWWLVYRGRYFSRVLPSVLLKLGLWYWK